MNLSAYLRIYDVRYTTYTEYKKTYDVHKVRTSYIVLPIKNISVYILKSTRKDLYDKYYAMIIFSLSWKFVRKI